MTAVYGTFQTTTYASRTNTSISAPTPITNGDLLLILHLTVGSGTAVTQTLPAGFTAIGTRQAGSDGSFGYSAVMGYKIAASESGADYVVTHATSSAQGLILRIDGTNTLSVDTFSQNQSVSNGTTGTALSVTPTAADDLLVYLALNWNGNAISPPSGMTERLDSNLPYFATQALASSSATGNKTQTFTSSVPWFCNFVAIKDATGGLTVTGAQTTSATTQAGTIAAIGAVTGAQATQAAATAGTITVDALPAVTVTGAQTTQAAETAGTIALVYPAANVTGAQTTLACLTTGTIGEQPLEVDLPGHGGGASKAYMRRLREAIAKRRKFEEERKDRYAALMLERPPLQPAPETVAMIAEVLVEEIDRDFENDGLEEAFLLLLLAA